MYAYVYIYIYIYGAKHQVTSAAEPERKTGREIDDVQQPVRNWRRFGDLSVFPLVLSFFSSRGIMDAAIIRFVCAYGLRAM